MVLNKLRAERVFIFMVALVLVLSSLNIAKAQGWLVPEQPTVSVEEGVVTLDSLTLEQKIGQMVIVHGGTHNLNEWKKMQLGGIHLFALKDPELYVEIISNFQEGMAIPFFVTADLEGCINPFAAFYNSTYVSEIDQDGAAFEKGRQDGALLRSLGFSINYAPVVDIGDDIWGCRSFPGNATRISELASAYVLGLESEGVIGSVKHYPGRTLVANDPHKGLLHVTVRDTDLAPFELVPLKSDVQSVMITHSIADGEVDTNGVPAVASFDVITTLRENFDGLIITDDTTMLGLRNFYPTLDEMYIAVWKAGSDLILNFDEDPNEMYRMILVIKEAVLRGDISEERIDNSVKRILEAKGFVVE